MSYKIICKDGVEIEGVTLNYIPFVTVVKKDENGVETEGIQYAPFETGAEIRKAIEERMEFLNKWSELSDEDLHANMKRYWDADMTPPDSMLAEWRKRNPSPPQPEPTPERRAYMNALERVERGELSEEDFEDGVW